MTQEERREYLLRYLVKERNEDVQNFGDETKQKRMLRTLMNVRLPEPISEEFLAIQDSYLQEENRKDGIVDVNTLPSLNSDPRLVLWRGDITSLKVDAIVNAANSQMLGCFIPGHSCIDNIIHSKSGIQLRLTCNEIMERQGYEQPTGIAQITPAFNLPCEYVIHVVGPIVNGKLSAKHIAELKACYMSCLTLASQQQLKSIALCCISTGVFHFPQREAALIATQCVKEFLENDTQLEKVVFNVFKQEDYKIYQQLLG